MIGILLSIIFPGLGQFYYGKNGRAIVMLILGLTPLYPIALVWSIIDIVRLNKRGEAPKFEKKEAVWGIVFLLVVIPVCFLILFYGSFTLFNWYSDAHIKPGIAMQEGSDIVRALNKYKMKNYHYPEDLQTIIDGNPVRARWTSDPWGQSYHYEISGDKISFKLISKGRDRILGTEDDIIFRDNGENG